MQLLERDRELDLLGAVPADACAGRGVLALVAGEAGIGKSSVIAALTAAAGSKTRVLEGHCDPLMAPAPLAPIYDIARKLGDDFQRLLEQAGNRIALYSRFVALLQASEQPILLIFEDIHWADDATCDLLKYLTRRVANLPVLLVATYRDDEIGNNTPLRSFLGTAAGLTSVHRFQLPALSKDAIRTLAAGRSVDVETIFRRTSGGAMGVHFVNGAYLKDDAVDIGKPEAVMYEPMADGTMQLVAVEYITFKGPAELQGHLFNFNSAPNRYGLDPFYELHVWAWKDNSTGTFADFNPDVFCDGVKK